MNLTEGDRHGSRLSRTISEKKKKKKKKEKDGESRYFFCDVGGCLPVLGDHGQGSRLDRSPPRREGTLSIIIPFFSYIFHLLV